MTVALWEWSIPRDAQGGTAGVSMTRHGAMQALARALIQAGTPRSGHVVPVILAEPAHGFDYYLRGLPERRAFYDGQVIQWR